MIVKTLLNILKILNKCISCQEKTDRNSRYEWGGWPTLGSAPALTALSNLNDNFDNI